MGSFNTRLAKGKTEEGVEMSRKSKYMWSDRDFDEWCKNEAKRLRDCGIKISTSGVTRMLHDRVIVPNDIHITDIITPKIKIKKRVR